MRVADQQALAEAIVAHASPRLRRAFLLSIERLRAAINRRELAAALASGNTYAALRMVEAALQAEPFRPLELVMHEMFVWGGRRAGDAIAAVVVRKRAPWGFKPLAAAAASAAQSWVSGTLASLANMVRQSAAAVVLRVGLGGAPEPVTATDALDSLGLSPRYVQAAERLRQGLAVQRQTDMAEAAQRGDLAALAEAGARPRLTAKQIEERLAAYRKRAAGFVGGMVGDNAARRAAHLAIQAVWEQAAEDGLINPVETRKLWHNMADGRVRHSHVTIPLMQPDGVPLHAAFSSPLGPIRHPMDPDAPMANVANCRCWLQYEVALAR